MPKFQQSSTQDSDQNKDFELSKNSCINLLHFLKLSLIVSIKEYTMEGKSNIKNIFLDDDDEHILFPEHNSKNNLREKRLKIFAIAWPLSLHMAKRTSFMT